MQIEKLATYPFIAHWGDLMEPVDMHWIPNSTRFVACLVDAVTPAWTIQIMDLKEMGQYDSANPLVWDRPYRTDFYSASGTRSSVLPLEGQDIYLISRWANANWYLLHAHPDFEGHGILSGAFAARNIHSMQNLNAHLLLLSRWDVGLLEGYEFGTDIAISIGDGGLSYAPGGTVRYGTLVRRGEYIYTPVLANIAGVRSSANEIAVFLLDPTYVDGSNYGLKQVETISCAGVCTDGDGLLAMLYKDGLFYLFESNCGTYTNPSSPPLDYGDCYTHMHICRIIE